VAKQRLTSLEICAGGGGQALGLELAGFRHLAVVDNDTFACATLALNRPKWNVFEEDVKHFLKNDADQFIGKIDLLGGGVPCPPFSIAGKQLGHDDERDLFPTALALARKLKPRAVMLENVRGLLQPRFNEYRDRIDKQFAHMGYRSTWKLLNSSDYGVPQLRPRVVCVALRTPLFSQFSWDDVVSTTPNGSATTVSAALKKLISADGWTGAQSWAKKADKIAPTLVGGSKKHGGPDLGPTRAKKAWAEMGVDGHGLANNPPSRDFRGNPKLTVQMAAVLQGFPPDWKFAGGKTAAYRQVGNAFPPPVAAAVAEAIYNILASDG
jgi:DNA (cytosine-5)-methyltransferase 1